MLPAGRQRAWRLSHTSGRIYSCFFFLPLLYNGRRSYSVNIDRRRGKKRLRTDGSAAIFIDNRHLIIILFVLFFF